MDLSFLLRGILIGFSIAAPVGPIAVLCIRRTLTQGRTYGLISGLGAATADAIYGCIAGFGLTFISSILINQQMWLRLIGGVFLCYLGARSFLSQPAEQATPDKGKSRIGTYASTFFLTLTNPMTILSFAAIFAGVGVVRAGANYVSAMVLVLGVFFGSVLWWLILSGSISLFRAKFKSNWLRLVNQISGIIIFGFGVIVLVSLIL
jgi:threonine/homoserine/homoserine lactone efflux protein